MKENFNKYFVDVIKNHYADFNGRARRAEYWYFVLFNLVIYIVLSVLLGLIKLSIVANLYSLAVLVPSIAIGFRRMHDVGKPGWFVFIPIYSLILALQEGEQKANEYGENPKA